MTDTERAGGAHRDGPAPRRRDSARVLVLDPRGRVLLFEVVDDHDHRALWITPGGGIEPGESLHEAASRELREETGLRVEPDALGGPVAVCRGEWTFRSERLVGEDAFFVLRVEGVDVDVKGWTDLEREVHRGWRWWSPDDLDATDAVVVPGGLAPLVRRLASGWAPARPEVLPWVAG